MKKYGYGKIVEIAYRILERLDKEEDEREFQQLDADEENLRVCMNDIIDRMQEFDPSL